MTNGETEYYAQGLLEDQSNTKLTTLGREQADKARNIINSLNLKSVVYSSLVRSLKTAGIACQDLRCLKKEDNKLKDCNFGDLEGKDKSLFNKVIGTSSYKGENLRDYQVRIMGVLKEILEKNENALIIAHTSGLQVIQASLKIKIKDVENGSVVKFIAPKKDGDKWSMHIMEQN